MLPISQSSYSSSSSHASMFGFTDVTSSSFGSHGSLALDSTLTGADPNSPQIFKQNTQIVIDHLARVQGFARHLMGGIETAYRPESNPDQTAAEMNLLKETLQSLVNILRESGVGAMPLLSPGSPLPTEQQLVADTTTAIQVLFEQYKRLQENSTVAANLLGVHDQTARR
ncbi:hypothetical protein C8Q75DRAFT_803795 [Abortiporus biennis]|nr:hypothetical protein C8Q75DRAFT_803795 [Abortiporus biennis]